MEGERIREWPVFKYRVAGSGQHQPEEAYALAERLIPHARRADLFSRQSRPGWDSWGNEAGKFDAAA